jgi:hypothetical protein
MTDTDMAQMPVAPPQKFIPGDFLQDVVWPVLGLGLAALTTIAWCAFLVWLVIDLFA